MKSLVKVRWIHGIRQTANGILVIVMLAAVAG